MENPLLGYFGTKYESAPFTKIVPKHFIPAIEKDIQENLEAIDKITNQTSKPSFDNTIDALQNIGEFLEALFVKFQTLARWSLYPMVNIEECIQV